MLQPLHVMVGSDGSAVWGQTLSAPPFLNCACAIGSDPVAPTYGETMLEVSGLSVRYGKHLALDRVGLSVRAGEIVVMLGANGAGKS